MKTVDWLENFCVKDINIVGGKNGYGAKIVNIFSDVFEVELIDRHTKQKYYQNFLII